MPKKPKNDRLMNKNESVLIINDNTIYYHKIGRVYAAIITHNTQDVFIEEFNHLSELSVPQLCEALVQIPGDTEILRPEYVENIDNKLISELAVPTDIGKAVAGLPNSKWYILTEPQKEYIAFADETVLTCGMAIDSRIILDIVRQYNISVILINNYEIFKELTDKLRKVSIMFPKNIDFFTDSTMTKFKDDEYIGKNELANELEIIIFDPFGRFGEDRFCG